MVSLEVARLALREPARHGAYATRPGEQSDGHRVAGRDSIRLAYVLAHEAGNPDLWEEARANWNEMRIAEKNAAKAEE